MQSDMDDLALEKQQLMHDQWKMEDRCDQLERECASSYAQAMIAQVGTERTVKTVRANADNPVAMEEANHLLQHLEGAFLAERLSEADSPSKKEFVTTAHRKAAELESLVGELEEQRATEVQRNKTLQELHSKALKTLKEREESIAAKERVNEKKGAVLQIAQDELASLKANLQRAANDEFIWADKIGKLAPLSTTDLGKFSQNISANDKASLVAKVLQRGLLKKKVSSEVITQL